MARITKIGLENFRVFKEYTQFDISPITILTGPNSSGKSSFFKALLLLKNNSSVNSLWKLDFSGSTHRLGTFKSTKNLFSFDEHLLKFNIEFELVIESNNPRRYPPIIFNRPETTIKGVKFIPFESASGTKYTVGLEVGYKEDGDNGKLVSLVLYSPEDLNEYVSISLSSEPGENHSLFIDTKKCKSSRLFEKTLFDSNRFYGDITSKIFSGNPNIDIEVSSYMRFNNGEKKVYSDDFAKVIEAFDNEILMQYKLESNYRILYNFLNNILSPLLSITGHFEYIEAFRANTRRIYTNDSQGTSFNELLVEFNATNITKQGNEFINKWLRLFKIADEVVFEKVEGVANTIYLLKNKRKTLLADLGFGITQFLPILMKIGLQQPTNIRKSLREKPIKKLMLLEEPETNLHPKYQSLVAEMIADAIKTFEVRFIIETHSEYFIRKLQFLTAKKEITEEDTSIYYIYDLDEKPDDKNQVEKINISANGALQGKFGQGFFDEANALIGKIWEAR